MIIKSLEEIEIIPNINIKVIYLKQLMQISCFFIDYFNLTFF